MSETGSSRHVDGDSPVGRDGDRLGRSHFADLVARQIRVNRPEQGLVVAVVGPWGAGKTSVLRMVGESLIADDPSARTVVVEFNPWMFSGSEQLTALFFLTLAEHLPQHLGPDRKDAFAERLDRYGRALGTLRAMPLLGGFFGVGADFAKEGAERLGGLPADLAEQRRQIADALSQVGLHVVVLIDDVDRLHGEHEIRDLMRMVKLVGDLPGFTYVLSYDRRPIVAALSSDAVDGEEYLQKIVQIEHRVPEPAPERLRRMLDGELSGATRGLLEQQVAGRWAEVFAKIVEPLIATPRDVRRYGNAVRLCLDLHGSEVDVVDQLALAALATFVPKFHAALPEIASLLTGHPEQSSIAVDKAATAAAAERLRVVAADSGAEEVIRASYALLFPHAPRLGEGTRISSSSAGSPDDALRLRQVSEHEVLWTYLSASLPEHALSVTEVRRVLSTFADPAKLTAELRGRGPHQLAELLSRLRAHVVEIPEERVLLAVPTIIRFVCEHLGTVIQPIGHPGNVAETLIAELVARLPAEDRGACLRSWARREEDVLALLLLYEAGCWGTAEGRPQAGTDGVRTLELRLARVVCEADVETLLGLEDLPRIMFVTSACLEREDRPALRALLADDRLFAQYVSLYTDPAPPGRPRPLQWKSLKASLGARWLFGRLDALPEGLVNGDDHLSVALRDAIEAKRHESTRRERNARPTHSEAAGHPKQGDLDGQEF